MIKYCHTLIPKKMRSSSHKTYFKYFQHISRHPHQDYEAVRITRSLATDPDNRPWQSTLTLGPGVASDLTLPVLRVPLWNPQIWFSHRQKYCFITYDTRYLSVLVFLCNKAAHHNVSDFLFTLRIVAAVTNISYCIYEVDENLKKSVKII